MSVAMGKTKRKELEAGYEASRENVARDLDHAVLYVAGGALAVSFGVVGFGSAVISHKGYLVAAWIFLGVALFSVIISMYLATWTWLAGLVHLRDEDNDKKTRRLRYWIGAVDVSNAIGVVSTGIGLVMFAVYLLQ